MPDFGAQIKLENNCLAVKILSSTPSFVASENFVSFSKHAFAKY